ncbi:ankyrin-3 [Heracleum sosnowskyi]|uniref:Ankyrin-3 n=1 Tax=Heracleum sosnowskyi TaxID=360622 RepID=A0AAD8IFC0_9APIA|nr:ankyrin-3 [Heracleum sosnowskyi]
MTVFGHSSGGSKQVVPFDYEAEVSQRLLESANSNDNVSAFECIADPLVDVNYVAAVWLNVRKAELACRDELPIEIKFEVEKFKMDVTPLFLAVHNGNVALVNKLLSSGADVNQKLFRGFSTTAAIREGHLKILEILLKSGASQLACEEALLEASCYGNAMSAALLMGSDLIRPHIALHALVSACSRGFVNVVDTLIKCGVDANTTSRVLLRSSKPFLHANIDCTALVAAIISRQVSVVDLLLRAGASTDIEVQLGAWSWDTCTGEEIRVGAGLADPYAISWLAVEYFEASGTILRKLLQHLPLNTRHLGRTLLHHSILCGSTGAAKFLLDAGAHIEAPIETFEKADFRPLHLAARVGSSTILQHIIDSGCDLNATTDDGDTALIICVRYKQEDCLRVLAKAGADFGLLNIAGISATSLAASNQWYGGLQQALLDTVKVGRVLQSSNAYVFSPFLFVARSGDVQALSAIFKHGEINLDEQDEKGFSAVMITAMEGHVAAFRLLVYAGADVKLSNKSGETAITLSKLSPNYDLIEKVMLEFTLERGNHSGGYFYALHYAARQGDLDAVKLLVGRDYDVNVSDGDGYTPLMWAAREGHTDMCELLIHLGAHCNFKNAKGETALSLARKAGCTRHDVESVILDQISRKMVLTGANVWKHTKEGRGAPHKKVIKMVGPEGLLRWGNSRSRNVRCEDAEVGSSNKFQRLRQSKGDADRPGLFKVITVKKKEIHFFCEGGLEMAELWVRGIKLVTREALSSHQ